MARQYPNLNTGSNAWNQTLQINNVSVTGVTNPLTSDLIATGFTVLNQSGNAPEEHSIRLSGSKVFNIVTTELTELFTVDANSNVSVGATGNVALLTVGNTGSSEGGTGIVVRDVYETATLGANTLEFVSSEPESDYRSIRLLNIFTPQINLTDSTNSYNVLLCSGNDDSTSGLTLTTPVYNALYTNGEMRITVNGSPPRFVSVTPYSISISNSGVATTITNTSVTSGSFVGALTGTASTADAITATATNGSAVHYPTFVNSAGASKTVQVDTGLTPLTYVPSTGTFTATSFVGALTGNADTATTATNVTITDNNTSGTYYPTFTSAIGSSALLVDSITAPLSYVPSTGTLTATNFSGLASSATAITITDTNTAGTYYPVFVNTNGSTISLRADVSTTPFTYNPNTGVLTTTTFVGALTGNSDTSTRATNITGGLGGQIPYQTAVNTTALLANGTAGQVLTSNGTTLAPSWGAPVGMVKVGTVSVAITGSASAQNLSFASLFTSAYRNYKIILRPTTQVSFSAYPTYSLQAYLGTSVPTTASLSGFELISTSTAVVTPIYTASGTISSAPLLFAVACITNRENQFDISNVGYSVTQPQQVTLMCKSVYNNPSITTGTSDRTINSAALSGCTITGLVIQQSALGVGNNFTLEASVYGYT